MCPNRRLPQEVQMMLVNPEVSKVGFATDVADKAKLALSACLRCSSSGAKKKEERRKAFCIHS